MTSQTSTYCQASCPLCDDVNIDLLLSRVRELIVRVDGLDRVTMASSVRLLGVGARPGRPEWQRKRLASCPFLWPARFFLPGNAARASELSLASTTGQPVTDTRLLRQSPQEHFPPGSLASSTISGLSFRGSSLFLMDLTGYGMEIRTWTIDCQLSREALYRCGSASSTVLIGDIRASRFSSLACRLFAACPRTVAGADDHPWFECRWSTRNGTLLHPSAAHRCTAPTAHRTPPRSAQLWTYVPAHTRTRADRAPQLSGCLTVLHGHI
ncbi:hypothetical protein B0H67DRAFT_219154 [Lasiosphaeris hirsuta]|uniref:Uncharacterized protein n=1 Tax=Lasiosphaeris hirsuta TaxID=260670 RepID=A0AA40DVG2_9PEZI|nr:hypothetical protein B0H67DRAFT_219154 [Lasiosphaeris hirsuta]